MPDDLSTRLKAMSDAEMLQLGGEYASLTDEAQTLVRSEFARRGLETPDAEQEPSVYESQSVRTIRRYRDQPEALLARSVLESAGIPCYLRDENTIRIEWIWSNYMGGIRLQVAEADAEAAEAILSQPIPARIAVEGEPDYDQPRCPNCGSLDVSFNNFDAKVGATSMLLFGFPLLSPVEKDYWRCEECGTNWLDETSA
jgi:DNA-directed RNA polymerase subunit RPC12/RpoP